jgi:hypothetical protein
MRSIMSRRSVLPFAVLMSAGLVCTLLPRASAGRPQRAQYQLQNDPLTISASSIGRFANGHSWYLSVNSAGRAEITIDTFPKRTRREFQVPKEDLVALRKALVEERFFDLADEYGEHVPDGSTNTLTITAGDLTKTVRIRFLMNWVQSDRARLREPSRAVRIMVLIRGWFSDAEAVDLRRYDQRVLDAVRE